MDDNKLGEAPDVPLINALRVKIVRRVAPPFLPRMVGALEFDVEPRLHLGQVEYRAYAEIGFKMVADERSEDYVRRHAVKAICNHVYGPVERELRLVQESLWEMGAGSDCAASKRIERLISVLRGEQPPA